MISAVGKLQNFNKHYHANRHYRKQEILFLFTKKAPFEWFPTLTRLPAIRGNKPFEVAPQRCSYPLVALQR